MAPVNPPIGRLAFPGFNRQCSCGRREIIYASSFSSCRAIRHSAGAALEEITLGRANPKRSRHCVSPLRCGYPFAEAGAGCGGVREASPSSEPRGETWNRRALVPGSLCDAANFDSWRGPADRIPWGRGGDSDDHFQFVVRRNPFPGLCRSSGLGRALPARQPAPNDFSLARIDRKTMEISF